MRQSRLTIWCLLVAALGAGCRLDTAGPDPPAAGSQQRLFVLERIPPERGETYLSELGLGAVRSLPHRSALSVTGSADDLCKTGAVLELVDGGDEYVIETLAPVSAARDLPSNKQIAEALGDMTVGTFANPPVLGPRARAIIDIHADSVVAVVPARFRREILALVELGPEGFQQMRPHTRSWDQGDDSDGVSSGKWRQEDAIQIQHSLDPATAVCFDANRPAAASAISADQPAPPNSDQSRQRPQELAESTPKARARSQAQPRAAVARGAHVDRPCADRREDATSTAEGDTQAQGRPVTPDVTVPSSTRVATPPMPESTYRLENLDNADDTLVLNLPEQLDMALLLDMAAIYLQLDYIYDPAEIKGQTVALKLQGKLRGEIKVKELYPLLESVLRWKGFAMVRSEGNLVTIVPVRDVLDVNPRLVDPNDKTIKAGDTVVTRMFELEHIDTFSAVNLLEGMKLTVAVSTVKETQTLIVTSYASHMGRIEGLLAMIDRPGKLRKVRFRQLQYITANMLAEKVKTLAAELHTVGVDISVTRQTSPQPEGPLPPPIPTQETKRPTGGAASDKQRVYLDADDRTNRILIIGKEEQLETVEKLVGAFDVPQQALREFQVYELGQVEARDVRDRLEELGVIGKAAPTRKTSLTSPKAEAPPPGAGGAASPLGGPLVEEPRAVVLEATNALLIEATREQHAQIAEIIGYVDKVQQDLRTLKVYDVEHVEAEEARRKLAELQICGAAKSTADFERTVPNETPTAAANPSSPLPSPESEKADISACTLFREPQVVVVESTNSLLANATAEQHAQIETVLGYIDTQTREEEIPYKVYPLENSPPSHLAEVLGNLIRETVQDKEGKIEKVIRKEEEITIVPDPNTYSLIVYASKKNQEWIASLVKQLDKRRPQVLIDVTLVEIRKTDEFEYDLNLISSIPDLIETGGQTGTFVVDGQTVVDKLLQPGMRGEFIDFQANAGLGTGFYADRHVNALLNAMQTKDYGRVLAKPKILVNDNEAGTIKTMDTTYVETKSGIPVSSGAVGTQQNFVETSLRYEPYEAGIMLDITPHISEGDLLRLDISLTRSDFLKTATEGKPPNTRSNEVQTAVTVPDGSTIILGGLLKFNQSKGGSKVPILGDIPIIGGLFRSIRNEDEQSKLYVFVKAEIMRPDDTVAHSMRKDLEVISERNRMAFERHEEEFQSYQDWPGIKPKPVDPPKVLDVQ